MKNKRPLALLSALAATPAFSAPFLAIGQNAELFLTASTSVRFEDNIDFASANKKSDEIFEFVPGIELIFGKNSLTKGSLSLYERFTAYSDNNQFNDELFNAVFNSSYEGAKISFKANASYRELNQTTQDVQAIIASTQIAGGLNSEVALTEKTKVSAGIQYSEQDYKSPGLVDSSTYTIPVNYYFAIRPKVDISAGVRYSKTDSDAAFSDFESYYFNVGARGEFTPKLRGSFDLGYTLRDADTAPGVDGDSGLFGFNAGLDYEYSPKTQFTFDASNNFDINSTGGGTKKTSFSLGARNSLSTALGLNAKVTYQMIDYIGFPRTDDFWIFTTGAVYTVSQHINFSASYSHYTNSSSFALAEFSANVLSLSANFRY